MNENEFFTFLTEVMNFLQEDMQELKSKYFVAWWFDYNVLTCVI